MSRLVKFTDVLAEVFQGFSSVSNSLQPIADEVSVFRGLWVVIYKVFAFKLPDSLREPADPQLVTRLKSGDPIVGFEVDQKAGVLGHACIVPIFLVKCKRRVYEQPNINGSAEGS